MIRIWRVDMDHCLDPGTFFFFFNDSSSFLDLAKMLIKKNIGPCQKFGYCDPEQKRIKIETNREP